MIASPGPRRNLGIVRGIDDRRRGDFFFAFGSNGYARDAIVFKQDVAQARVAAHRDVLILRQFVFEQFGGLLNIEGHPQFLEHFAKNAIRHGRTVRCLPR